MHLVFSGILEVYFNLLEFSEPSCGESFIDVTEDGHSHWGSPKVSVFEREGDLVEVSRGDLLQETG